MRNIINFPAQTPHGQAPIAVQQPAVCARGGACLIDAEPHFDKAATAPTDHPPAPAEYDHPNDAQNTNNNAPFGVAAMTAPQSATGH